MFISKNEEQFRHQSKGSVKPNINITKDPQGKAVIDDLFKQNAKCVDCYRYYEYVL